MIAALARLPVHRVLRTRRAYASILGFSLLASVGIAASKSIGMTSTADHVMRGGFGIFVVPLVSYAVVGSALGGDGLRRAIASVVALGAEPKRAALATALVASLAAAIVCAVLGVSFCVFAHGPTDPPLLHDVVSTFGVAALGGAAYGAFFSAGSAIGKGYLRGGFLAVDWIFGSDPGFVGFLTPRGHVRSLLGGPWVMEMAPRGSSVILVLLIGVYLGLTVALTRNAARST